jgi:hypothetical protein
MYHYVQNYNIKIAKNVKIKLYNTIVLSVFLCRYETWSLTLNKEHG